MNALLYIGLIFSLLKCPHLPSLSQLHLPCVSHYNTKSCIPFTSKYSHFDYRISPIRIYHVFTYPSLRNPHPALFAGKVRNLALLLSTYEPDGRNVEGLHKQEFNSLILYAIPL